MPPTRAPFDPPLDLPRIPPGVHLQGDEAALFEVKVVKAYTERFASIRDICAETGRSYGSIHKLLAAHVTFRGRGYAHPTKKGAS
ncbi:helix-turn-helix domain-containing protein (plasmid) [Streptomyces sp. NBC_00637]|uniref:helix-turn-helix domain-containing protein n=1 Tax=Streptomyces sp. NBC_00637 TaxID=2903667 RepID=UPI002F916D21